MTMKLTRWFFLFFFHFIMAGVSAQKGQERLITSDFRGVTLEEFVKQVEAKTDYYFYYDPKLFDLIILNIDIKNEPLDKVLKEAFKNSDYSFAIDGKRVFLLKGQTIKTNLSAALGGSGNIDPDYVFVDSLQNAGRKM